MTKFLIKWFFAIVYICFVISTLCVIFFIIIFTDGVSLLLSSVFLVKIAIVGSLVFWFANKVLVALEKSFRPTAGDHIRQSAILYAIILAAFLKIVFFNEYHLGLNIWPAWVMIFLSFVAIFINAVYLFWFSRRQLAARPFLSPPAGVKSLSAKIGAPVFSGPVLIFLLLVAGYYAVRDYSKIWQLKRAGDVITPWHLEFEKPVTAVEALRILGPKNEMVKEILFKLPYGGEAGGGSVKNGDIQATLQGAGNNFKEMSAELVYPTDEQLAENAKDSAKAAKSIASMRQVRAADQDNLQYVATHGVPVSGVNFKVSPGQAQAFRLLLFAVFMWLVFWFTNKALIKLARPTIGDHYRQSAIFYTIILAAFLKTVFFNEYRLDLNSRLFWTVLLISPVAIIINTVYIYRRRRITFVIPSSLVSSVTVKPPPANIGLSIFIGPALILLLMVVGYYVRQMQYRIEYLRMNPPPRVASPNDPPPPADLQSLSGRMPTSTMINTDELPLPSPDLDKLRW